MFKNNPLSEFLYINKHYHEIEKQVNESNRNIIIIISSIALPILVILFLLSLNIEFLSNSSGVYGAGGALALVCLLLTLFSNKDRMFLVKIAVYLLAIGFLIFGMATSIVNPTQQSVSFHVILLIIPCVFVEKPDHMFLLILSAIISFIILTCIFDLPEIRNWDLTNGIAYGILSLVIDLLLVNFKIKRFYAEKQIRHLSSTDILTGLNNRNSYEKFLEQYNPNSGNVKGCIFVDVNGLHELNNTKGHKAGDDMLKTVAEKIEKYFAGNNIYRIGGDEFLIIITDNYLDEITIKNNIMMLKSDLAINDYFISVGYSQNETEGDIVQIINEAETEMYFDKKQYYKDNKISNSRSRIHDANEVVFLNENDLYDKVTGSYSENGFCKKAKEIIQNSNEEYAIIFLNVSNFKAINEIFGYKGGDTLLLEISKHIDRVLKRNSEIFGRLSADRFVLLLKSSSMCESTLKDYMSQKWTYNGHTTIVHLQAGVYFIKDKSMRVEGMIDRARMARTIIAKDNSKIYGIFEEQMYIDYIDQASVLADFETALNNKEFKVFYQPIVKPDGKVASAEALVRWIHPKKGFIAPNRFIPILEKSGLIPKLDKYVAEYVFDVLKKRVARGEIIVPAAINLSWYDLDDEQMKETIVKMIQSNEVPPGKVRFEATERTFNTMETMCKEFFDFLSSSGCKLLLDDFGSGYSTFNMIQKFNFDILKIDCEFTSQIENNYKTQSVIKAIINMCHDIGIEVVAEGVETKEQKEFLISNGCDYMQGYYFARPMPEKEFIEYLETHI